MAALALALLSAMVSGCGLLRAGPFRGQIVDADTTRPVPGAVVLAVWLEQTGLIHSNVRFQEAREAVTDAEGRFEFSPVRLPLFKAMEPVSFIFFAPGYLPPNVRTVAEPPGVRPLSISVTPPDGQPFVDPTVVPMRRILTQAEWCAYELGVLPIAYVPRSKMPLLIRAVQTEARARGLCH